MCVIWDNRVEMQHSALSEGIISVYVYRYCYWCVVHVYKAPLSLAEPGQHNYVYYYYCSSSGSAEQLIQSWLHGDDEHGTHAALGPSLPPPFTFNPASDHRHHWWVPGVLGVAMNQ